MSIRPPAPSGASVALPAAVGSEVHPLRITPEESGRAAMQVSAAVNSFNGTTDPTIYLGYNFDAQGNLLTSTEPAIAWGLESDYNDGTKRTTEAYIQMAPASGIDAGYGVPLRPFHYQMNRATGQLVLSLLACGTPGLQIVEPDQSLNAQITKAQLNVYGRTDQDTIIRAKAGAGRSSQIGLGYNDVDDRLTIGMGSATNAVVSLAGAQWGQIRTQVTGGTGTLYQGTGGANDAAHIIELASNNNVGRYVKRASSAQAGDLDQLRDENGNVMHRFNKGGYSMTRKTSAPADADLAASEMAVWFDHTPGAAKAMFKAKDSAGTVVSGSVALA